MSYSDLTTYVNTTSKCGSRDGREITRITPHEMAARWTGPQCADYFCSTDRECSSNYCIGYDGSIACNVEEEYRAWTSSSYDNDSRAITVEISNDDLGIYDMTDAAINAFVDLCVDLFRRYPSLGGKAVYTGDTDGNITFHRWFASTACPGDWFADRIYDIVDMINERLEGDDVSAYDVVTYRNPDMDFNFSDNNDLWQNVYNAGHLLTYKNEKVNGKKDLYQLITDASKASAKIDALEKKLDKLIAALDGKK